MPESDLLGAAVPSSYYEIRITGVLPPEALLDFDRLTASTEPVETVLHGPLRDQAALNGLLARLEAFGVQIIEIRRFRDRQPPSASERDSDDLRQPGRRTAGMGVRVPRVSGSAGQQSRRPGITRRG